MSIISAFLATLTLKMHSELSGAPYRTYLKLHSWRRPDLPVQLRPLVDHTHVKIVLCIVVGQRFVERVLSTVTSSNFLHARHYRTL